MMDLIFCTISGVCVFQCMSYPQCVCLSPCMSVLERHKEIENSAAHEKVAKAALLESDKNRHQQRCVRCVRRHMGGTASEGYENKDTACSSASNQQGATDRFRATQQFPVFCRYTKTFKIKAVMYPLAADTRPCAGLLRSLWTSYFVWVWLNLNVVLHSLQLYFAFNHNETTDNNTTDYEATLLYLCAF